MSNKREEIILLAKQLGFNRVRVANVRRGVGIQNYDSYLSLGHQNGKFLTEYEKSCSEGVYRTIESSPVATKLINHIDNCSQQLLFGSLELFTYLKIRKS